MGISHPLERQLFIPGHQKWICQAVAPSLVVSAELSPPSLDITTPVLVFYDFGDMDFSGVFIVNGMQQYAIDRAIMYELPHLSGALFAFPYVKKAEHKHLAIDLEADWSHHIKYGWFHAL